MRITTTLFPKALTCLALISGLLFLTSWTGTTANAEEARPCAEDLEKFCKDVQPGGGRIHKCLKDHAKELSPACKEHVKKMKAKAREAHKACMDDIDQFCGEVKPGGGSIAKCLKQHEDELSTECKDAMGKMKMRPMGKEMKKPEY